MWNTIEDNNVKHAVFLSVVGDTTYQLIRGILSLKNLTEVYFSDIIRTRTSYYNPKKYVIVERFKFNTCNKKSGQSVTDYIAELKELSRFCVFGKSEGELTPPLVLEANLWDQLVCGHGESRIQGRLLSEMVFTYQQAITIAKSMELADKGTLHITGKSTQVHAIANTPTRKKKQTYQKLTDRTTNRNTKPCYMCSGAHKQEQCPFKGAECFKCKKNSTYQ